MSPSPATDSGSPLPGTVPDSAQDEQRKEIAHAKTVISIRNSYQLDCQMHLEMSLYHTYVSWNNHTQNTARTRSAMPTVSRSHVGSSVCRQAL